ncbi:NAD(P)H-hydrate epimerase, partial [Citrobacter amalonaticus]|uniref:NAD(P)H-hydrate epimerase n=1 Tax=Citrobacter amalonaticus TaxID=35703 RepID=UPI0009BCB56A
MTDHTMKKNPISIPHSIWPADDIKRLEREAADTLGLTLFELMLRAGEAVFDVARESRPYARRWLVLCGHGNNGGDGYVVARLAKAAGILVTLVALESDKPLPEEAAQAREAWLITILIVWEAIERFYTPRPVAGGMMMIIAVAGLLANILAFWILH